MTRFVIGARKTILPNWAVAACLASFVGATYLYSIRAVATDNLEEEISANWVNLRQLPSAMKSEKTMNCVLRN